MPAAVVLTTRLGGVDMFAVLLFFTSCLWLTEATSKLYPPRTLQPRAADMFKYFARQPFDGQVNAVFQVNDMNAHPQIEQTELRRLRGLYNHLREHPALMDSRLTASRRPDMEEFEEAVEHGENDSLSIAAGDAGNGSGGAHGITKRKLELPLTESCPSVTEWISLNKSRDIHDNEVEVFQPNGSEEESQLGAQFFYTTRCINGVESEPCTGTSFLYRSKCLTRKGYVMALVRKKPEDTFDWNWIQVPVSCNCAVSKKF